MTLKSDESAFEIIRGNQELYAPLSVTLENEAGSGGVSDQPFPLNMRIAEKTAPFEAILISSGLLRNIEFGILKASKRKNKKNTNQILIIPFLSNEVQLRLNEEGVSALDLSGNYYIVTSDFVAIRLDQKNRFKEQRSIQNIYSRNSSIAARWLLTKKSVKNNLLFMKSEMDKAGSGLSLGTISKVLKILEEDVLILRTPELIKVLKPEELLVRLKNEYRKPEVLSELRIKLPDNRTEAGNILNDVFENNSWTWSGESSAERYASTVQQDTFTVYTKSTLKNARLNELSEPRFYNCIVQYISDPLVYFDKQENYVSAVQSYIELARSDKRNQEIAEDIKEVILNAE